MLNYRDQENAERQGDEMVRRYGQKVAAEKVDEELASTPGNLYWEAVRQRVVAGRTAGRAGSDHGCDAGADTRSGGRRRPDRV